MSYQEPAGNQETHSNPAWSEVNSLRNGGPDEPFSTSVYVNDFIMASLQVESFNQTALAASASLASDHVRLFGSGEKDEVHILAPNKSTDYNSIVNALGFTINTHTVRISITKERVDDIRHTLEQDWPRSKQYAREQDVSSMADKLWNPTYVVRAGRYFVWQPLRLTDLHKNAKFKKRTQILVKLGWEFHNDIASLEWAIGQQLVSDG